VLVSLGNPYLVAGLIRRESAFNPVVVSGAGAMGLMQIVPETGRQLGHQRRNRMAGNICAIHF